MPIHSQSPKSPHHLHQPAGRHVVDAVTVRAASLSCFTTWRRGIRFAPCVHAYTDEKSIHHTIHAPTRAVPHACLLCADRPFVSVGRVRQSSMPPPERARSRSPVMFEYDEPMEEKEARAARVADAVWVRAQDYIVFLARLYVAACEG